jgi:hypothetical protein
VSYIARKRQFIIFCDGDGSIRAAPTTDAIPNQGQCPVPGSFGDIPQYPRHACSCTNSWLLLGELAASLNIRVGSVAG